MDTQMINFSIPTTLLRQMDRLAKEQSKTRSEFIREAIRQYLYMRQEQQQNIMISQKNKAYVSAWFLLS